MKNNILGIVIASSITTYATGNFNIIVAPKNNDYNITTFFKTGNIQCDSISPLENEIYKDTHFKQKNSNCKAEEKHSDDNSTRWVGIPDFEEDKVGSLLLNNCSQILNGEHGETNGVYTVMNNSSEMDVLCDMTTDGGGWTLVAYAGSINRTKEITTGNPDKKWLPLFFNFGVYQKNAISTKESFSRFDLFKNNSKVGDEFLAKRTSLPSNMLIFPITYTSWWGNDKSADHFPITTSNRDLPYLRLTNSGNSGWKSVSNDTDWFVFNGGHGSDTYPGIDWNRPEGDNSHDGHDFNTSLGHRTLLYWESGDLEGNYAADQWFHAQPMTMGGDATPDNNVQDMEFWYREK